MTSVAGPESPLLAQLPQLSAPRRLWSRLASMAASAVLVGAVLFQLRHASLAELRGALPDTPWFVLVLAGLYLALPVADWIIFRRLWRLPVAGFPIVLGKRICNELLLSYSGELYFYLWARRRAGLATAPFGTIKDVNILSALAGNVLSLVLLVACYPLVSRLQMGHYAGAAIASAVLMLAGSMTVLLLSRRLFTLARPLLAWVFAVHLVRLIAGVVLCALLWELALPDKPLGLWLALSTIRLLVARLPLVPNREILFAAVAVFLVGEAADVAALIALTSTAMLLLHLLVGGVLALAAMVRGDDGLVWPAGAPAAPMPR